MIKYSICLCMNLLNQYMHAFNFKMMILTREIICIIGVPQATNEHDASFHLDPGNPVFKNLGKYQCLFHNTATFIFSLSFSKRCRYKFKNLPN